MPYNLKSYRGTNPDITVNDKQKDSGSTSITFIGKDTEPYGETILTNFYNILENFAGTIPPSNPVIGQIWYDTSSNQLKTYSTGGTWESIGSLTTGTTFPSPATTGELFFNDTDKILYVYDGTSWIGINDTRVDSSAPSSSLHNGVIWFNTNDHNYYIYTNGVFNKIVTGSIHNLNTTSKKNSYDFVSLESSASAQFAITYIEGDIALVISDNDLDNSDLTGKTYIGKDGTNVQYDTEFPDGIKTGLNIKHPYSNLNFCKTQDGNIRNLSSDPNSKLNFIIGNDNIASIKKDKVEFSKPLEFTNFDYMRLPVGTTANRPSSPQIGQIRYNQSTNVVEYYNGSTWVELNFSSIIQELEMSYSSPGLWTVSHGLTNKPKFVSVIVRCVSNDFGYSAGDDVYPENVEFDEGGGAQRNGFSYGCDNNLIFARIFDTGGSPNDSVLYIPRKDTFALEELNLLTNTNWKLIAKFIP